MRNEHHEQIKSIWFPCPTCGKLFPSKFGIRSHLGLKHCEKAFPTTSKEKEEKSRLIVLELKDKERIELLRDPEDVNQALIEKNQIINTSDKEANILYEGSSSNFSMEDTSNQDLQEIDMDQSLLGNKSQYSQENEDQYSNENEGQYTLKNELHYSKEVGRKDFQDMNVGQYSQGINEGQLLLENQRQELQIMGKDQYEDNCSLKNEDTGQYPQENEDDLIQDLTRNDVDLDLIDASLPWLS